MNLMMSKNSNKRKATAETRQDMHAKRIKLHVLGSTSTESFRDVFPFEVPRLIVDYVSPYPFIHVPDDMAPQNQGKTWLHQLGARLEQKCSQRAERIMMYLMENYGDTNEKRMAPVDAWHVHSLPLCAFHWFNHRDCFVQIVKSCSNFTVYIVIGESEWTFDEDERLILKFQGDVQDDDDKDRMLEKEMKRYPHLETALSDLVDNAPVSSEAWHLLQRFVRSDRLESFVCLRSIDAFSDFLENNVTLSWPINPHVLSPFAYIDS